MSAKLQADQQLTFDRYRADLPNGQLWRGNRRISLTSKAFAVLRYLLDHAGQLVTKAELFDALWPDTVVSDGALTFCIVELRKALGDNAKQPKFIETVHGQGYRFLPAVTTQPVRGLEQFGVRSRPEPGLRTLNPELRNLPLVGRDPDLTQLHRLLDKALSGQRQIVFVTGEPGIGKTTLIEAFRQRLEAGGWRLVPSPPASSLKPLASPVSFAHGQCIEHYGPGEPYMPILEALGRLCRESGGEQLVTLLTQHAPTWVVQMPALLKPEQVELLLRTTQHATRERMLREMGEALEAITAERPLVLWLEDLHWSDASTLELLSLLARRRELARLLVIGTYRPVDVIVQEHPLRTVKQELHLHSLCVELPLRLLSEAQVAEYLAIRFDADVGARRAVPLQSVAQAIHRRTDGNPLFMVTLVDDLVSQGVRASGDTQEILSNERTPIETRVPDTVQQLITQQIERLSTHDRHLLEVASVVGMEFSAAAVAAGFTTEVESVEERCAEVAQHGRFLRANGAADWPDGTVAMRYTFLHALYQEVLYQRIPAARRRRLHQQIGERHEQAYGERTREIATELAVHFEQGRDYGKAVQYLQQAGENAMRRSAYGEAIRHFTKGLALLKILPATPERTRQELRLLFPLGESVMAVQGYAAAEVEPIYTRALMLSQEIGETPQRFRALVGLWAFYCVRGPLATARELGEQLVQLARTTDQPTRLGWAHLALGTALFGLGEFVPAQTHLEQCLAGVDTQRPRPEQHELDNVGVCRYYLVYVLWHLGYPDQARQRAQEVLAFIHDHPHPRLQGWACMFTDSIYQIAGGGYAAQQNAETFIALAHEQGFLQWLSYGTVMRGRALVEHEQLAEGIAQLRHGLASHAGLEIGLFRSRLLAWLAEAYGKIGQVEEGLTVLVEALAHVEKMGERFYEAELYRLKGELTLQRESQKSKGKNQKSKVTDPRPLTSDLRGEAEACFLKASEIAQKQQAKSLELRAVISLARLRQRQAQDHATRSTQHETRKKLAEAHRRLSEVYNWFTEGFDTKDLLEAKAVLEELRH